MLTKEKGNGTIQFRYRTNDKGNSMAACSPDRFLELFQRVVHKYIQFESKKRYYGTDILITVAEIHTIDAIGGHDGINLISLAKYLGVTKGSASQMIYKLVDKGLVEKNTAPNSDREIVIRLTEKGKQAYDNHKTMHQKAKGRMDSLVANMSPDILAEALSYMERFESELDNYLDEES